MPSQIGFPKIAEALAAMAAAQEAMARNSSARHDTDTLYKVPRVTYNHMNDSLTVGFFHTSDDSWLGVSFPVDVADFFALETEQILALMDYYNVKTQTRYDYEREAELEGVSDRDTGAEHREQCLRSLAGAIGIKYDKLGSVRKRNGHSH
ncbi:hypothetical protein ABW21_db0202400 [Orbilia brochopaga]|nr:hypothetical protein ABW21_db0202400 [Drechslerella brochopaga]